VPTNLNIDNDLLGRAKALGHHRTKRETVECALREYLERLEAECVGDGSLVQMFGTIDFDPDWSPRRIRGKADR